MRKNIKELALEVEKMAIEKGFTSIEPSPNLIRINSNNDGIYFQDFIVRRGNKFAGRVQAVLKNARVEDQTAEVLEINF